MAKSELDRTTLDLFEYERRPGRPKTNPLPRELQLKVNKRNQLKRDKARGLKRVEFKVSSELYQALNDMADAQNISRSALIETILQERLAIDT
ncbi:MULTISPECIES: LexA regulated protein [Pseudoalteromonas]|uniref:LexA regulated protein n=1 Tax=Pseudoalteromonas ruthenica TaxID=151081 RepID=A0A0F4PWD5_9GAMM|nr:MULTISPECIES: LexA regulated protein [Pseudoalteromonas]KJY99727.1 LexA regulated protein [Pseudoalteromonas ruthenica]KJZ00055.1 LexA regulated protein [Pseudoalteromonas ruthenica]MBS3796849.1 LexA regulated protein [Pseudoalteromonas sp. BDTF-M6]MCF2861503.1 LexA regulated protein [Pseudoalteromonas sp. CNAT2-18]MCG7542729.1 LexA regulated protein [Pseudoalteromonas sp. MM17-2]|tara:strand:- start:521 stop:799 length:279 start_codon:yes stop_codon:yes gene_type:complete